MKEGDEGRKGKETERSKQGLVIWGKEENEVFLPRVTVAQHVST